MNWLVHKNNLEGKIARNYKRRGSDLQRFKTNVYLPYHQQQMAITGLNKADIVRKKGLLEQYLRDVDDFNENDWITAQSKFRSTVIEEFCGYLFKDLPIIGTLGLDFISTGIFAGIRLDYQGNPQFETKNTDFSISKKSQISFGSRIDEIVIPVVAVECKTYVDKTMLNEAQFAAQKIKGGSPRVKVLMVAETNQIRLDEIPSQTPIDQIYILRGQRHDPIDGDTIWQFFCDVRDTINKIGTQQSITLPGVLLIK